MTTAHDFSAKTIKGEDKSLADYKGNVLLVVNVASECGFTPQYTGLETLNKKYRDKGLRVLGFPANEFGAQEPGSNDQIATFCKTQYDVSFDMFGKIVVKGEGIHPLYAWLTKETNGDVKWNFQKYLVGKNGEILERFSAKMEPTDPAIIAAIEKAL